MKLLVAALPLLSLLAHGPSVQAQGLDKAEGISKPTLGLNDVSILMPINDVPGLMERLPSIHDRANPKALAPQKRSLPLDDKSFVPIEVVKTIEEALAKDVTLRTAIEKAEGAQFTPSFEAEEMGNLIQPFGTSKPLVGNPLVSDVKLVSIRMDPCANILRIASDLQKCRPELRIVWQMMRVADDLFDGNIHSIHVLSHDDFADIVATMRELKAGASIDTTTMPLKPHPVIAKEGLESPYLKGVLGIVHRYARFENLAHVAFFSETSIGGHWPFLKMKMVGGKAELLPSIGGHTGEIFGDLFVQRVDSNQTSLGVPSPMGMAEDNMFRTQDGLERIARSHRLDNPTLHDTEDSDCASCHMTHMQREEQAILHGTVAEASKIFQSAKWDLSPTIDARMKVLQNLHAFSYAEGNKASIFPRTVNESAQVADFINSRY